MGTSKIEWTEITWNPTSGCNKISAGCKFCYAEIMSKRLKLMGQKKYQDGFKLTIHPDTLSIPFTWKKPRVVFVNSMSDLFHEDVPLSFVQEVFKVMNSLSQHTFQVLTKRADILAKHSPYLEWTDNIWMGVSVENQKVVERIEFLKETNAFIKFLSIEPLIGPIKNIKLDGIDWVIVGGESGPKSREIKLEWVLNIKEQCVLFNVPFFFKQWGGKNKKKTGRLLEGKTFNEMPLKKRK